MGFFEKSLINRLVSWRLITYFLPSTCTCCVEKSIYRQYLDDFTNFFVIFFQTDNRRVHLYRYFDKISRHFHPRLTQPLDAVGGGPRVEVPS